MTRYRQILGTAAAVLAISIVTGCVEQKTDLHIRGVVRFPGTQTTETIDCGDDMNTMEVPKPIYNCSKSVEAGNAQSLWTRGVLNIDQMRPSTNSGQLGLAQTSFSDEAFCAISTEEYINTKYRHSYFEITLDLVNRLNDAREVGAEGQGGGGGGFEGLYNDPNDVHLKELEITFPEDPASEMEKTIEFEALAESGGGGFASEFIPYGPADIDDMRRVHRKVVQEETDGGYDPRVGVILNAQFVIRGETLGGNDVESNKFQWPIQLCGEGCETLPVCDFAVQESGG